MIVDTCREPSCFNRAPCSVHGAQPYDRRRGSAASRGYNAKWKQYRDDFVLRDHCEECGRNHSFCEECGKRGRIALTYAVDHIVPHRGNQELFWRHSNHQGLCQPCHNSKSRKERLG